MLEQRIMPWMACSRVMQVQLSRSSCRVKYRDMLNNLFRDFYSAMFDATFGMAAIIYLLIYSKKLRGEIRNAKRL